MKWILPGNETLVHHHESESNQESMQWHKRAQRRLGTSNCHNRLVRLWLRLFEDQATFY